MREGQYRRPRAQRAGWRAGAAGAAPKQKNRSRGPDALTPPDGDGGIRVEDAVVAKIAAIAAREVDGVTVREVAARGQSVGGRAEDGAVADLRLVVAYGVPIPRACESVRRNIIDRVENFTGLRVTEVNVVVEGLSFPEHEQHRSKAHPADTLASNQKNPQTGAGESSDLQRESTEAPEDRGARSAGSDAMGPGRTGAPEPYAGLIVASFSLYRQTVYTTARIAFGPFWVAARGAEQNARFSTLVSRAALGIAFPAAGAPVPRDTEGGDGTAEGDDGP